MKNIFLLFLTVVSIFTGFSQGNIEYSLRVTNNNDVPASNLTVNAVETTTLQKIEGKTGIDGKVLLKLNNGNEWAVSIGEMKNCIYVTAIPYSIVEMNEIFIYDLIDFKRKSLQDENRINDKFKVISQNNTETSEFKTTECFLITKFSHPDGYPLPGITVKVINSKDSLLYKSITNKDGKAFFILPNNKNYDVDVNDFKNYSYCDFKNEYVKKTLDIIFAPTVVNETIKNDTVYQNTTAASQPSSERALIKLIVRGGKNYGKGEQIYLRQLNTNRVYTTKTDNNSIAFFLLPVKYIYMINFDCQKDVDAINLMHSKEMSRGELNISYDIDPRIAHPEEFIPTSDKLFLRSFNSFLTKQFEKPKDKPFLLYVVSAKKINKESKEALFMLRLTSSDSYGAGKRLPLNVAFVLDESGSMYADNRAECLKKALWDIGNSLTDNDIVSVVLFDTKAAGVQHSYKDHLTGFEEIINYYNPGGSTNILDGIQVGVGNIVQDFNSGKSNKIILLTDGYGDNPPEEITDYVEKKFSEGIEFSTIGLGTDYNQALLELIARKGNGTFSFVDTSAQLSDIFLKELKSAFSCTAKDLKIEIYHNKKLVFSNLFGFPVKSTTDESISFEIAKLPQNRTQLAFLKFKIDSPAVEITSQPLIIKVSYFDLVLNKTVTYEQKVNLEWTNETNTEFLLDQEEKKLYAIAILNQTLKTMAEAYDVKDNARAKQQLLSGIEQMKHIFPEAKPKEVQELFDDVNSYLKLFTQIENKN